MPEKINWTLNVQVVGGPKISTSDSIEVDIYSKLGIPISGGEAVTIVDVLAGSEADFLLITASNYTDITYAVDGGSGITLDGPHTLIGAGAVGLIGATQNQFAFTNNTSDEVIIDILVGRSAITL